jgi:hypothetical protein
MLLFAIFKDITDFIPLAGFIMTPLFYLSIFIWQSMKDNRIKRITAVRTIMKGGAAIFIDLIPALDLLPEAMLLIFLIYLDEKYSAAKVNATINKKIDEGEILAA